MNTNDLIELRSPYRPYPLGAKKELRDTVDTVEFSDDDPRVAFVSETPPDSVIGSWELSVVHDDEPVETWETDRGELIEIFDDRVEQDGSEVSLSPKEAKEAARRQDHFSRTDTRAETVDSAADTDPSEA